MKIVYAGFNFEAEEVEKVELFETLETYGVCFTLYDHRQFTTFHRSRPLDKFLWIKQNEREHMISVESLIDVDRNGKERLIPGFSMVPGHDRIDFLYDKYVKSFNRIEDEKIYFTCMIQQLTKDIFNAQAGVV